MDAILLEVLLHPHLPACNGKGSDAFMVILQVSKTCKGLGTLLLDGIGMTDYGLQNVVQQCTKLQTLRFRYGDGVTDSSLLAIAQHCTGLKSLTLDFWNKFNQLSVSDNAIKKLLCACTQLVELSLCNCMILTGILLLLTPC